MLFENVCSADCTALYLAVSRNVHTTEGGCILNERTVRRKIFLYCVGRFPTISSAQHRRAELCYAKTNLRLLFIFTFMECAYAFYSGKAATKTWGRRP